MSTVDETKAVGEAFLEHYGIKGMRWGVRRTDHELARARSLPDAEEHVRARQLHTVAKKAGTRKLTNKDLEELNKRLNLEQNYSNLTTKPRQKDGVAKGASWLSSKMLKVGDRLFEEVLVAQSKSYLAGKGVIPSNQKK